MKKIITTVSAMTLTLSSGSSEAKNEDSGLVVNNDLEILYASEENFKGSGFFDLSVEKTVMWTNDNDGSGDVTVGDELTYSIMVTNLESEHAENVQLFDLLDSRLSLNLGTVAITQGLVLSGNDYCDPQNFVDVRFGDIAADWFALAHFDVTVTDLAPGLNIISNSAEVYGPSGSFFVSDDPSTPLFDPTRINAYGELPDMIYSSGFEFSQNNSIFGGSGCF